MPTRFPIRSHYYQQFDADFTRDVPAEGYGGWKQAPLEFDRDRCALVVMHAWDTGTREQYPGWHRAVEYIPRADRIAGVVLPPILDACRKTGFRVYHVVGGGDAHKPFPGFKRAVSLAEKLGPAPRPARLDFHDPVLSQVHKFRAENVFVGRHNEDDVNRGWKAIDFMKPARPVGNEGIAEDGHQLVALCKADKVNHLIYVGFAINWCLLLSPGGMHDMSPRGLMCSTIRQATTAVENGLTARLEIAKDVALWRVALAFGFVFDDFEFIRAVKATKPKSKRGK